MAVVQQLEHYLRPGTLNLTQLPPLSLYIHIPWCLKKCPYCDFNSHALTQNNLNQQLEQQYANALVTDLQSSLPLIWGRKVQSIFFGGGTPSLFAPQTIDNILSQVRSLVNLTANCEITLEANPGTFETNRFKAFAQAGVNRLSVGVQSFNNACLQAIGRVHNGKQAIAAVQEAASCFAKFNLDLMYALPQQNLAMLQQDLTQLLQLNPSHVSIYHLTVEPNTYFAKFPPKVPEDDVAYAMLDLISEQTQLAGLKRYEISAYAKDGHQAQHNLNYWNFGDYLGIGAGAHSKLSFAHRIVRQVRYREPNLYMQNAVKGQAISQENEISRQDLPFEYMLNALRLIDGFALNQFTQRTGLAVTAISKQLEQAIQQKLIEPHLTWVKPTTKGIDFLTNLQTLFLL